MLFLTLADLVMILHLVFVIFVVCGGLLVLRWRWIGWQEGRKGRQEERLGSVDI